MSGGQPLYVSHATPPALEAEFRDIARRIGRLEEQGPAAVAKPPVAQRATIGWFGKRVRISRESPAGGFEPFRRVLLATIPSSSYVMLDLGLRTIDGLAFSAGATFVASIHGLEEAADPKGSSLRGLRARFMELQHEDLLRTGEYRVQAGQSVGFPFPLGPNVERWEEFFITGPGKGLRVHSQPPWVQRTWIRTPVKLISASSERIELDVRASSVSGEGVSIDWFVFGVYAMGAVETLEL